MLSWLYHALKGSRNVMPPASAASEAKSSTSPAPPTNADTSLSSPDDATKRIKTEAVESAELLNGAHEQQEPAQPSVEASTFISLEESTATMASQGTPEGSARDMDVAGPDGAQDQPFQPVASTGDQVPLPQDDFPIPPAWSLRPPAKRRRTVKSIEGAEQEGKKAKEARIAGPAEWTQEQDAALFAGEPAVDLIPQLGIQSVQLDAEKLRRPQLLAEYIRRRTGDVKTAKQISDRITALRTPSTTARLRGPAMSLAEAVKLDWDARLGPDQFPQTRPASLLVAYGLTSGAQLSRPSATLAVNAHSELDKKPCLDLPGETLTPLRNPSQPEAIQALQNALKSKQESPPEAADSGEIAAAASPAAPVHRSLEPTATAAPKSSPSRKRSRTPDTKSFATDLSAILSSVVPGRDLTPSAHALFACGITSTSSFAELLVIDADVANVYLDFVGKRTELSAFEVAWTKKALDAARRSLVRMV